MEPSDQGLVPARNLAQHFEQALNQAPDLKADLSHVQWSITSLPVLLDSANIQPQHWEALAKQCIAITIDETKIDGIVIIHGTDTLAYTASALAYFLSDIKLPVIITGSQKPLYQTQNSLSDALDNLSGSLLIAGKTKAGVYVFFHDMLMPAARVVKKDAISFDGFATPRLSENITRTKPYALNWQNQNRPWASCHVAIVYMMPGFKPAQLKAIIETQPSAIILSLYGAGTLPDQDPELIETLTYAQAQNIILVGVSQCYIAKVDFSIYAAGNILHSLGVLNGKDLTLEAAYTKLMVLLRMGYTNDDIKHLFITPLVGEMCT